MCPIFSRYSPMRESARELKDQLPDPVPVKVAAKFLGISEDTCYGMCKAFIAGKNVGDLAAMRGGLPCIKPEGRRRFIIPRAAFVAFYTAAGLSDDLLRELYGDRAVAL
jgi:hypothetical protein